PVTFTGDALGHAWPDVLMRFGGWAVQAPRDRWIPRARAVGRLGRHRLAAGDHDDPYLLLPAYTRSPVREPSPLPSPPRGEGEGEGE
ncbi:MAG: hypothetical protein ACRDFT_09920, partial [bacterium]